MKFRRCCLIASGLFGFVGALHAIGKAAGGPAAAVLGPVNLRVDNLATPLGIDDAAPSFSWQLNDAARGAKQTAYEVMVATAPKLLRSEKPDVWSSGRVDSSKSLNVRYAGPALTASKRYYWSVRLWGANGRAYPGSEAAWWETGLMSQDAWKAHWIGYETPEEAGVRHASALWIVCPDAPSLLAEKKVPARLEYRAQIQLDKPVKQATLFATGEETVAAWINGTPVIDASAPVPWHQLPWKKFVRGDATRKLVTGANTLALESVLYTARSSGPSNEMKDTPPIIATLFVEYADGSTQTFASGTDWKSSTDAPSGWEASGFDDSQWKPAIEWRPATPEAMGGPLGNPWIPDSVKVLRHTFNVSKPVKSARLYSTALGEYEIYLNGKRVGNDVFAPGWTDYREWVVYQTYDVTNLIVPDGPNAIGALLAPGWYSTPLEWFQQPNNYGATPPALRAQLRIEHTDGSIDWINTSPEWQAQRSFIRSSELYDGETQDARDKQPGWDSASFDASAWKPAIDIDPKPLEIVAQDFQPIRVEREMRAKTVREPKPGVYIYDFGQNLAGVERLRISGPAGTDVRLRFGEILNDDGTLYTENLRTAKATDHFILAGKGNEEFEPQFDFHGFRYAEITGVPTKPSQDALTVLVVHTGAPFAAELSTGSAMVNQLWSNILWGQRSNFIGVPTDCPQRDERLGWMGDAQVFWRTATYNMDLAAFSRKYAHDIRGTQQQTPFFGIYAPGTSRENTGFGPGWSDAGVIIPWTSWLQNGDTRIIDQNWAAMQKYVEAITDANPDGLWQNEGGIGFGDWLSPEGKTDQVLIATAYWAYDVTLMKEMARATGRTADEETYAALFEKIRAAFDKRFVHPDGFVAGAYHGPAAFDVDNPNIVAKGNDTQTGYVLALHMNLLPDNLRAAAAQKLVDKIKANHGLLGTGFLGTPYLLEELTKTGHPDVAYSLLLNTRYPSWGYLIEHGATTTWERWNGDAMKSDPAMNSYNHYAYGAVADWIYRYAAGVDATPLDAGYHTIVLHPHFDARLGSISLDYPSSHGLIHSDWKCGATRAEWHVTIPANTVGWLPLTFAKAAKYKLQGMALIGNSHAKSATRNAEPGFELQPGSYSFEIELTPVV